MGKHKTKRFYVCSACYLTSNKPLYLNSNKCRFTTKTELRKHFEKEHTFELFAESS